jgi:hypothetical protein
MAGLKHSSRKEGNWFKSNSNSQIGIIIPILVKSSSFSCIFGLNRKYITDFTTWRMWSEWSKESGCDPESDCIKHRGFKSHHAPPVTFLYLAHIYIEIY